MENESIFAPHSFIGNPGIMIFREARTSDIQQLQLVRQCVKENVLLNSVQVTEYDYLRYLTIDGKGWVCEVCNKIIGFAIVDCKHRHVWALFVKPGYDDKQVGRTLHDLMLGWYFKRDIQPLSLTTAAGTNAEEFYRLLGWTQNGKTGNGGIKFQMELRAWKATESAKKN
jgi:N-acetylglutamate synthase-like GNAT family acetyltransferase